MKKIKYSFLVLALATMVTGCMEVIEKPDTSSAGEYIWDSYEMAQMYLDNLYLDNMPQAAFGGNITSTDEALGTGASNLLFGLSGINSATDYSNTFWARMRRINLMIQEMNERSNLPEQEKAWLIGQARFLRAIKYWQLVRLYGGIPIVDHPIDPVLDEMDIPRSSTKECIRFIVEDLDYALAHLPKNWLSMTPDGDDFGRLTSLAAMAYKGRVLMSFASPMFTKRDAYTSIDVTASTTSIEAFSISQSSVDARWEEAYQANKMALDSLLANGYALVSNWSEIFTTEAYQNPEAIMVRLYTGVNYTHDWEYRIRPRSMGGTGDNINPTLQLEKSFLMADGKRTSDSTSGYDPRFFWFDRDPRFYQTLVYNGAVWDMAGTTGRRQWIYDAAAGELGFMPYTGLYCRKAQDVSLSLDNISRGSIDWMEMRLAEVILNLAECANETGRTSEAIDLVRQIRSRAGILNTDGTYGVPAGTDYTEMLDIIMNERFIELAFENQRYWDLRRRRMYTDDLTPSTHKLNNTRRTGWETWTRVYPKPGHPTESIDMKDSLEMANNAGVMARQNLVLTKENYYYYFDPDLKQFDLNRLGNPNPANPRSSLGIYYRPDYYFLPIGSELFSNSVNLKQTLGWGYGDFDPLAE